MWGSTYGRVGPAARYRYGEEARLAVRYGATGADERWTQTSRNMRRIVVGHGVRHAWRRS